MIQQEMNRLFQDWNQMILLHREKGNEAAQSENEYRRVRAKFIIEARDADPRLSQAAAETLADADDDVMSLRLVRVAAEQEVKAMVEKLRWFRARADALRSEKVDERESNRLYADHGEGA